MKLLLAIAGALSLGASAMAATTTVYSYGVDVGLPPDAVIIDASGWNMAETVTYVTRDPPAPAPEPTSLMLLGGAMMFGLGLTRNRRRV